MTRGGYSSIPTAVLDDEKITGDAKLVLLALSSWAGCDDIFPSQQTIAKITGKSVRHVRDCLVELRDKGLVEWRVITTDKGRMCTYRLVTPWTVTAIPAATPQGGAAPHAAPGNGVPPGGSGTTCRTGAAPGADEVTKEEVTNKNKTTDMPAAVASGATVTTLSPAETPPPPVKPRDQITADFEIWYAAYPRHVGRGKALEKYRAARRITGVTADMLLAKAQAIAQVWAGAPKADREFLKHPATWLHQQCWLDEEIPLPRSAVATGARPPVATPAYQSPPPVAPAAIPTNWGSTAAERWARRGQPAGGAR